MSLMLARRRGPILEACEGIEVSRNRFGVKESAVL
jgi:hypothetical protein